MDARPLDAGLLQRLVDAMPAGVALCDARAEGWPVVYANAVYGKASGDATGGLIGQPLDRLPPPAGNAAERVLLRDAAGEVTHCMLFCRTAPADVPADGREPVPLPGWLREDRISGTYSRAWFDELMAREWQSARREARPLTLLLFDVNALGAYNDTFGRAAGDAIIRRVAHTVVAGFRRGTDLVGRWEDGCIAVLAAHRDSASVQPVLEHARAVVGRIAALHLHHPRSPHEKFITVTAGGATRVPSRDETEPVRLVELAVQALREGKLRGHGQLNLATEG